MTTPPERKEWIVDIAWPLVLPTALGLAEMKYVMASRPGRTTIKHLDLLELTQRGERPQRERAASTTGPVCTEKCTTFLKKFINIHLTMNNSESYLPRCTFQFLPP